MYPWPPMFLFFFTLTWESSKSWCALDCLSFLLSHLFCSPTWDCSQSWYALGKPKCGGSRVGVPLAIHLCFFLVVSVSFFRLLIHPCGAVAKAGVPLAVHLFFQSLSGVVAGVGVPLATHLMFLLLLYTYVGQ